MSEFESSGAGCEPPPSSPSRDLIVVERPEAKPAGQPRAATADRLFSSRFHVAAAAALAVVVAVAVAGALFVEDSRQQAKALAEQASENESLAHTLKSLKVRLDAIDSAMSNAGLADLRQSVGEIRSNLVSTREFSGALTQLSQRVDKLDHEASAKVDKLTSARPRHASRPGFRRALTSSSRKSPRRRLQHRLKSRRPSNPRLGQNSTTFRWIGRAQSNGQDRFCAGTSCLTLAMTSRWSAGAMASAKSVRETFSPERDAWSVSSSGATAGWS